MRNRIGHLTTRNCPAAHFTLVELLVTVAILMILAAMLFPTIGRSRENARRTKCRGNLSQFASAVLLYANDWNGFFPYYRYDATAIDFSTEFRFFWLLTSPYLPYSGRTYLDYPGGPVAWSPKGVPTDLLCPSAAMSYENGNTPIALANLYQARPTRGGVYQTALTVRYQVGARAYYGARRVGGIPSPSTYFIIEDAGFNDRTDDREFPYWKGPGFIDGNYEWGHGKYYNVAFLDGHVKPYRRKRRLLTWEAAYTRNFSP